MPETVKSWGDIVDNFHNFNAKSHDNNIAFERLSQFSYWYYLPKMGIFAPGKFLGYRNTALNTYTGEGDGGTTRLALKPFFNQLEPETKEFYKLYIMLEKLHSTYGKKINKKTRTGNGGIFIPKKEQENESDIDAKLFTIVDKDVRISEDENLKPEREGERNSRLVNYYERNPSLRTRAIQHQGFSCKVCGFNFKDTYGQLGEYYIEVHHVTPLHTLPDNALIDPKKDLIVVCANCHRMIHRKQDNPVSIEELKEIIQIKK